jgi:hypothetical protein
MSTPITLSVGSLDLTYNTGYMGMDHGMLYQESDRQYRRHEGIDYDYAHSPESLEQMELCFCRTADSTPFGHSAHADPDTCSTIIRTGSRSAATQGWHC